QILLAKSNEFSLFQTVCADRNKSLSGTLCYAVLLSCFAHYAMLSYCHVLHTMLCCTTVMFCTLCYAVLLSCFAHYAMLYYCHVLHTMLCCTTVMFCT